MNYLRQRRPFSSNEDEDDDVTALDEQEQEALVQRLSSEDQKSASSLQALLTLLLLGLTANFALARLDAFIGSSATAARALLLSTLGFSSLAATADLVLVLPLSTLPSIVASAPRQPPLDLLLHPLIYPAALATAIVPPLLLRTSTLISLESGISWTPSIAIALAWYARLLNANVRTELGKLRQMKYGYRGA